MAKRKVRIDYLHFLNAPQKDDNSEFFFQYLNPDTEQIESVREKNKFQITRKYQEVKQYLLTLQKLEKPKIKSKIKLDKSKKIKSKFAETNTLKETQNKLITREMLTKALELKVDGYAKQDIVDEMMSTYSISVSAASKAVEWCYRELAKDIDENQIRVVVLEHGQRYDAIYKKLITLEAPKVAMKSLRAKENLNNIGSDIFEVQVNNIYDENEEEFVTYGLANLTQEEQKELFRILKRMDDKNEQKQLRLTS